MNFKYKFCIWLIDTLLLNKQGLTIDEIQHKWRISSYNPDGGLLTERSFHRYRNETESLFNIDIVCENHEVQQVETLDDLADEIVQLVIQNDKYKDKTNETRT